MDMDDVIRSTDPVLVIVRRLKMYRSILGRYQSTLELLELIRSILIYDHEEAALEWEIKDMKELIDDLERKMGNLRSQRRILERQRDRNRYPRVASRVSTMWRADEVDRPS
jgi:chromosome segregation ATPase